jgi:hypothetical protein
MNKEKTLIENIYWNFIDIGILYLIVVIINY